MGTILPGSAVCGVSAPCGTPTSAERLTSLFELHHVRLVRTVRARLGRYDWHLAEGIAGATWLRAGERIDQLPATDDKVFGWLARLAWTAQIDHYRRARNTRKLPTDLSGASAYLLPPVPPAEATALARIESFIRDEAALPLVVAA